MSRAEPLHAVSAGEWCQRAALINVSRRNGVRSGRDRRGLDGWAELPGSAEYQRGLCAALFYSHVTRTRRAELPWAVFIVYSSAAASDDSRGAGTKPYATGASERAVRTLAPGSPQHEGNPR